jgi:hypothetical protein
MSETLYAERMANLLALIAPVYRFVTESRWAQRAGRPVCK